MQAEEFAAYLRYPPLRILPCSLGPDGARSRLGGGVDVPLCIVDEVVYGQQGGALSLVGQRAVGADAGLLYDRYVLPGAVGPRPS